MTVGIIGFGGTGRRLAETLLPRDGKGPGGAVPSGAASPRLTNETTMIARAKKTTAKKTTAKKAPAKKMTAKKAPAKQAPAAGALRVFINGRDVGPLAEEQRHVDRALRVVRAGGLADEFVDPDA